MVEGGYREEIPFFCAQVQIRSILAMFSFMSNINQISEITI